MVCGCFGVVVCFFLGGGAGRFHGPTILQVYKRPNGAWLVSETLP